jgi:hypothetical protein
MDRIKAYGQNRKDTFAKLREEGVVKYPAAELRGI